MMDEIALLSSFQAHVADPGAATIQAARSALTEPLRRRHSRRLVLAAALGTCALAASGALAAVNILDGPAAPSVNDSGLQNLLPPLGIGHARTLATLAGRTLFGARTKAGGYCFSATSPTDPDAGGGYCLPDPEATRINAHELVGFPISGGTVAGYAPAGATHVRLRGLGLDTTVPVARNGWWVGNASAVYSLQAPEGFLTATALDAQGHELASDPVIHAIRYPNVPGVVRFAPV
jgi:hypothetical protein